MNSLVLHIARFENVGFICGRDGCEPIKRWESDAVTRAIRIYHDKIAPAYRRKHGEYPRVEWLYRFLMRTAREWERE